VRLRLWIKYDIRLSFDAVKPLISLTDRATEVIMEHSEKTIEKKYTGSCHCGAVRFEVTLDGTRGGRCNCSVCTKINPLSGIVKPEAFTLLAGEENLSTYEWGAKISKRHFCKSCGVHCFGRGFLAEVGGAYVSVNMNTLDEFDPATVTTIHWDGRNNNWEGGPRQQPWPMWA
jgi:hypothetical protein